MTDAPQFRLRAFWFAMITAITLPLALDSCSSTKIKGVPDKLPEIALAGGSTATPGHHMAGYEYPFDASGNHVTSWAAEGERRAGRPASATSADEEKWSRSHGGRATSSSHTKKTTTGKSKSTASKSKNDNDDAPKSKSSGGKYVVKKGDTVERIAARNGISVKALMSANGLKSDLIRDGQKLTIPQ